MGDDIIEAVECLKFWVDCGVVYRGINSDLIQMESTLKALESYSLCLRSSSVSEILVYFYPIYFAFILCSVLVVNLI